MIRAALVAAIVVSLLVISYGLGATAEITAGGAASFSAGDTEAALLVLIVGLWIAGLLATGAAKNAFWAVVLGGELFMAAWMALVLGIRLGHDNEWTYIDAELLVAVFAFWGSIAAGAAGALLWLIVHATGRLRQLLVLNSSTPKRIGQT